MSFEQLDQLFGTQQDHDWERHGLSPEDSDFLDAVTVYEGMAIITTSCDRLERLPRIPLFAQVSP